MIKAFPKAIFVWVVSSRISLAVIDLSLKRRCIGRKLKNSTYAVQANIPWAVYRVDAAIMPIR
jgi:hypothetical protein